MPVPKLRFKDENGKEYSEWEQVRISNLFNLKRGNVLSVKEIQEFSDNRYCYPVYSSQTKNKGLLGYYFKKLYANAITWTTDGANAGKTLYRNGSFYCTNVCGVLLDKDDQHNANVCTATAIDLVTKKYVSYVGNPKLMNNIMADIKIYLPSLPEQEKIADFLSNYDRMIDVQSQRVEAMKTRKKGLLQKIFSQEIRFKDDQGHDYPAWGKNELGNIADFFNGDRSNKYPKPTEIQKYGVPFINAGNLKNGRVIPTDYITKQKYDSMGGAKLKVADILFCLRGTVGKNAIYDKNYGSLASSLVAIRVKNGFLPFYLYEYINSNKVIRSIDKLITGLAQPNLSCKDLKKVKINIPSFEEQQKIADFLTAVDDQIEVEEKRLETMKTIKKGLLQQMFI